MKFNKRYFTPAVLIFIVEILIAYYVTDNFVRPYVGDVLVVILLYCFIKSFLNLPAIPLAVFVLIFAFTIEFLQYINIVKILGLQHSTIARVAIGTLFEWRDLVAYVVGILIVLFGENVKSGKLKGGYRSTSKKTNHFKT